MQRVIVGYHLDEVGDWVAHLSCGHRQHVRHRPPFQLRAWVVDEEGRRSRLGAPLECPLCDRGEPVEPLAAGDGGEAACYAHLVCPGCGKVMAATAGDHRSCQA